MSLVKNLNRIQSYAVINGNSFNTYLFSHLNKKSYTTESSDNAGLKFALLIILFT